MKNQAIAVIGKGAWGKAIYHALTQNKRKVTLYGRDEKVSEEICILAVPTQSLRNIAQFLPSDTQNLTIINTAKGIEQGTHRLPYEIIRDSHKEASYYSLIGPSFADEVVRDMPTLVNLGCTEDVSKALSVQKLLQTDVFRVRITTGVEVLELSGALKNIYAIGAGLADGLGYEANTRIQLLTLAIEEARVLFQALNLTLAPESVAGTIGDLVLTCNSSESRNFRFGRYLASMSDTESLKQVGSTVEGYYTLDSIRFLEKKAGVKLPLASFIQKSVQQKQSSVHKRMFEAFIRTS